jgi:hypothetical protein
MLYKCHKYTYCITMNVCAYNYANIHVLLLTLRSRLQLIVCRKDKDDLQAVFCVVICKTASVHTKCHITLDTFINHCSFNAPRWTHTTSPLLGIATWPVLTMTCVQSSDVTRNRGGSPYRRRWLWLMPSPCQHLSDKGESKISVWDFLPTTWR